MNHSIRHSQGFFVIVVAAIVLLILTLTELFLKLILFKHHLHTMKCIYFDK